MCRGDTVTSIQKNLYARFAELDPEGGSIAAEYSWRDVLPVPAKTGYVFEGWYTASVGGVKVTSLETFQATSNCTLFAHWLPLTYTVILDGGDGFGSETISGVRYGEEIVPGSVMVARPGSRITGWSQTAGGELSYPVGVAVSNLTTVSGAEVRLFAVWGDAEIMVHSFQQRYPWNGLVDVDFTLNGDADREYPLVLEVMDEGATNLPVRTILDVDMRAGENPFVTESGRHRVIWDAGADLPDGYKCGNVSARLCHAMFVEFDACGGVCEVAQGLYVLSEPYNALPTPTKAGCVFQGWYRDAGYKAKVAKESVVIPSARTLYARWEVEK